MKVIYKLVMDNYGPLLDQKRLAQCLGIEQEKVEQSIEDGTFPIPVSKQGSRYVAHYADVGDYLEMEKRRPRLGGIVLPAPIMDTLPTTEKIIDAAICADAVCGVYFLVRDNRITYVGQSRNCLMRIASHMKKKQFDGYSILVCKPDQLDKLESYYITTLDPEDNILGRALQ